MTIGQPSHVANAFKAIGRNVVNFQRLEQRLKALAALGPILLTPETAHAVVERRQKQSARLTLGQAVEAWLKDLNASPELKPTQLPSNTIALSISISWQGIDDDEEQLAADLQTLVRERNELIHVSLAGVTFEDESECTKLVEKLDAQNFRIVQALNRIMSVMKHARELVALLANDEVQDEIIALISKNRGRGRET